MTERDEPLSPERIAIEESAEVAWTLREMSPKMGPNQRLWEEILDRIARKMDSFKLAPSYGMGKYRFVPQQEFSGSSEEIQFHPSYPFQTGPVSHIKWESVMPIGKLPTPYKNVYPRSLIYTDIEMNGFEDQPILEVQQEIYRVTGFQRPNDVRIGANLFTYNLVYITNSEGLFLHTPDSNSPAWVTSKTRSNLPIRTAYLEKIIPIPA